MSGEPFAFIQKLWKKTQDNVIESIQFYEPQQGNYLFARVENLGSELTAYLQNRLSRLNRLRFNVKRLKR